MLRNKGRFWKRLVPMVLLMLVSIYTIIARFDLKKGIRATSSHYDDAAMDDASRASSSNDSDRILFQNPPHTVDVVKWRKLNGHDLFERANYRPKPLVMGFVVIASGSNPLANYNTKRRHHYQLEKIENKSPPQLVPERVHTVQIHPHMLTVVRGNKIVG